METRPEWKRPSPLFWEHEGNRAMRENEWKLVSEVGSGWELYNMSEDRTELHNLANVEKDRVNTMIKKYMDIKTRCFCVSSKLFKKSRVV